MSRDHALQLREALRLAPPAPVEARRLGVAESDGHTRTRVEYAGLESDRIPAFLFEPLGPVRGAVVVFHQHAGAFHLGKSEVAGLAGEPLQAFGPALAARGVAVLAPDAITFEDRRAHTTGTALTDGDWLQHYNAMAYRLVDGDVLLRTVLDDAQRAVSVLAGLAPGVRLGVAGHSYGGTTALYLAAVDDRCRFACASGSVASLGARRAAGTGLNMVEVVPGLAELLDTHDLVRAVAPRDLFVVSATDDPYAVDAEAVLARAEVASATHLRVEGPHALDRERHDAIMAWLAEQAARPAAAG
ncbi:hypothetical protein [Rubrivirga sp. IMCC43871]|uniref:hypothetical protein n=1 Tax=Rubrivirga sp. IMCC43871 TaxID=3391575 RepID=UPI00398FB782